MGHKKFPIRQHRQRSMLFFTKMALRAETARSRWKPILGWKECQAGVMVISVAWLRGGVVYVWSGGVGVYSAGCEVVFYFYQLSSLLLRTHRFIPDIIWGRGKSMAGLDS